MESVFLSVIIPYHKKCGNIAPQIGKLYDFLKEKSFSSEVLIVSGTPQMLTEVSCDRTSKVHFKVLEPREGTVMSQSRSYIEGVKNASGEWALLLDTDILPLTKQMDLMIAEMDLSCDIIRSYRINSTGKSFLRRVGSWGINTIFNAGLKTHLKDVGSSFSAYRKKIYQYVSDRRFDKYHDFLPFVVVQLAEKDRMKEIPVEMPSGSSDTSSYRLADLVRLSFKILSLKITS